VSEQAPSAAASDGGQTLATGDRQFGRWVDSGLDGATVRAMKIRRLDHVGLVVDDLAAAKAFFLGLGLELLGEGDVGGDWVGQVIGLTDVSAALVMLRTLEGGTNIELVKFHSPPAAGGPELAPANTLGIRHIAMVVDEIEPVVARARELGAELVGRIVDYKNTYRLCYLRGPEGIILELAQEL
jgi:catechol 2,3-dioxygenase-like lactoylglutathione lyase family enzyme